MDIQQNNVAILHFNLVNQDGSTIFIRKTKLATFNLINPSEVSVPITDIGFDATLNQCWIRVPKASNATTGQYYGVLNIVDDDWGTYTTSKIKVYSVVSDADEDTKSVVFTATCLATQVTNPSGGNSPYYNATTETWWQYSDTLKAFEDTGVGNLIKYITKNVQHLKDGTGNGSVVTCLDDEISANNIATGLCSTDFGKNNDNRGESCVALGENNWIAEGVSNATAIAGAQPSAVDVFAVGDKTAGHKNVFEINKFGDIYFRPDSSQERIAILQDILDSLIKNVVYDSSTYSLTVTFYSAADNANKTKTYDLSGLKAVLKDDAVKKISVNQSTAVMTVDTINGGSQQIQLPIADGEDLENVIINDVEVIREKTTKPYDAPSYSGMGRVILRKNMVNGVNVLTQEMINQANTIYEIRYDFDLNDVEITIPEGCVLDFQGGSLSSGTLNCNNTILNGYNFIDKTIVLHGTIANEYIEFDWFKNEKWSISDSRYSNFINGSKTEFGEIPTISDANRTILENLLYNKKGTYFNINKAIKFGSGIYPFDSSVNVSNSNIFYLFGTHKSQTLLWSPNDDMFKVADQSIGRAYPRLLNVSIEAKNNILAHYNPTDAAPRAIHGYRIQGCRLISYEKHIIHPLADYDTDEAMVGHAIVLIYGSELKDCEIYANGHSKTIIDENGNNIGASAIFNCCSNSWVYDNVVDSFRYFSGDYTSGKGLMFAMFYNSSFLEMSKSNISYGGFEYLIYLKGALYYNYIHNCTLELPTGTTKYIYYSNATNSKLILNDCNIIGVNKVRLGATNLCAFGSNIASQLSIERDSPINLPSYNTEFKGYFVPKVDAGNTVGRLVVTKTSDNNAYSTIIKADIQEVIDEIKGIYKISGNYTPQDIVYCGAFISDAMLLRYPIHSNVVNTSGVIRVISRKMPRLAYTDRNNNAFAVFSISENRICCVSTLAELKEAFGGGLLAIAGQDVKYNYAVIVKDIDLNGESIYCRNATIWCFGGSLTNGALTGVHNIIDFSGDATITFDAKAKTTKQYIGKTIFNDGIYKVWDGKKWVTCNGISEDAKTSGTFEQKPTTEQNIPIGYAYFCADKQTAEGTTNGIMIYHKGNNVWVDALGRVVS